MAEENVNEEAAANVHRTSSLPDDLREEVVAAGLNNNATVQNLATADAVNHARAMNAEALAHQRTLNTNAQAHQLIVNSLTQASLTTGLDKLLHASPLEDGSGIAALQQILKGAGITPPVTATSD